MRNIVLIAHREFVGYLKTLSGYIIATAVLLIDGLLFNAYALGSSPKLSSDVLQDFFFFAAGTTMIASVFLSMRLIAEERQSGTITLLFTSPVRESDVIIGKFISSFLFLALLTFITLYMPLMIFVNGKVSLGHIVSGYLGLLFLGAASLGLGILGSALGRSQLVAAVLSASFIVTLLLCWLLARIADPPLATVIQHLSLFDEHFQPFRRGLVRLSDIVFYTSIVYFALLAATRVLQGQRWR